MFLRRRPLFRAFVWDTFASLLAAWGGLCWCIWLMQSPTYTAVALGLTSWIWWFWARMVWRQWRKTLEFKSQVLLFFDGHTHHQVHLSQLARVEIHLSPGNFRLHQLPGHILALHPRDDGAITNWDLSGFSLRVVFQVVAELWRRAKLPPVDVHFLAVSTTEADVGSEARRLGDLMPVAPKQNPAQSSHWERVIQERQRHVRFTPKFK